MEDVFNSFGGIYAGIANNPFSDFGGLPGKPKPKPVTKSVPKPTPKKELMELLTNVQHIPSRDNTTYINPVVPVNNSQHELERSKKAVAINQREQEKDAYYNPKIKNGITSGDKEIDLVYNNQWLMNTPIIGKIIKDKAYDIASRSGGDGVVSRDSLFKDPVYKGDGFINDGANGTPLLDVYFGKKTLPKSIYKPTSDYMTFLPSYSIKNENNIKRIMNEGLSDAIKEVVKYGNDGKVDPSKYDYKTPVYLNSKDNSALSTLIGIDLGGHKVGINFDKEKNLPYISVSDAWDFEPNSYSKKWSNDKRYTDPNRQNKAFIESSLMHKAGTPFKVYDRFYFDPKTKKYIPDQKVPSKIK
jgi:hypothetical protein